MLFDSHIHLDQFSDAEIDSILQSAELSGVLAVATNLASCERLLQLKYRFPKVHIAAGFHPEQVIPSESEQTALFTWIEKNHTELTACGEVGLPHYLKRENPDLDYRPYIALLERFVALSKKYDLPLNLHIVYDDIEIALELLAKYQIQKAHFHWFKANQACLKKLLDTPYFVSLTPDILLNRKTQIVAEQFPLERILVETDAPWGHSGFLPNDIIGQLSAVVEKLAEIKMCPVKEIHDNLQKNWQYFYQKIKIENIDEKN